MKKTYVIFFGFTFTVLLIQSLPAFAKEISPVYEPINSYLATPAPGHLYEIPVIIMRFLPTVDGENLDVAKAPDYWILGEISLADMKARIDTFDKRIKFMLEEGSRFRGYKDPQPPSLGYRVVEYITVYEHTPPGPVTAHHNDGTPIYSPDFHQIFDRFNMKHYVNNLGVKEIWVWMGGGNADFPSYDPTLNKPEDFRHWWESNMSSPLTGDISNSNRDNTDLPIYNSTYVVYGQNIRRTQAEAIHNHGHQLEAILSHVNHLQFGNIDLFWKKFVGQNESGDFITGRAGSTHMPPNTTKDYDYTQNTTLVESDIEDWTPDNSGAKKLFNVDTYGNLTYPWPDPNPAEIPQRVESQWYIYWMQNMPGHENRIKYGQKDITNWWVFTADWDAAISSGTRLVSQTRSSVGFTEMSDEFDGNGQVLQSFWQIRNGDKSSWGLKDGQLVVDAGFNQNLLWTDTTTRFYQVTDKTEFDIETSMVVNYADVCAVAGIVVYSATGAYVTLKLHPYHSNPTAALQFQRHFQNDIWGHPNIHLQIHEGRIPIQMRIKRDGDNYETLYKPEAQGDWISVGSLTVALQGPVEIGIYAGICDGEGPGRLTIAFDYFRVTTEAETRKQGALNPEDVNHDGMINIQDLILVAARFGQKGQNDADINRDGIVNTLDLIMVANVLDNAAAAPSLTPQTLAILTASEVEGWLIQAQQMALTDLVYLRGITALEQLLAALTPKETILLPSYPNPFNPETWIPYHLARAADVQVTIYDTRGTMVRRLALGHQPAGYYTDRSKAAYWDGRNESGELVASGVYFYQLRAGGYSASRRMVIVK